MRERTHMTMKRITTTAALAALAAGAFAGQASAHTAEAAPTCESVTVSGATFPDGGVVQTRVYVNGRDVPHDDIQTVLPEDTTTFSETYNLLGLYAFNRITTTVQITAPDFERPARPSGTFAGNCGAPPVTPPATPPVAPPVKPPAKPPVVTPPPVVRTFDCAWVASHYAPRLRPKVARKLGLSCRFRPPAAKTCADLLRVGAGPRWYTRLGFPYRCRVNPPVTG